MSRDTAWSITEKGVQYLQRRKAERQRKQYIRRHIKAIPVYHIPERTDGKPSINTLEGWNALRERLMQEQVSKET